MLGIFRPQLPLLLIPHNLPRQTHGFNDFTCLNYSSIWICSPDFPLEFCSHKPSHLLETVLWICNKHLTFNTSKTELTFLFHIHMYAYTYTLSQTSCSGMTPYPTLIREQWRQRASSHPAFILLHFPKSNWTDLAGWDLGVDPKILMYICLPL